MKASLWFLVALLVAMPVSFLTDPEEFTDNELIRAYCELVKRERFYKYHKLKENCFLYVRIFTEYDQVCLTDWIAKMGQIALNSSF